MLVDVTMDEERQINIFSPSVFQELLGKIIKKSFLENVKVSAVFCLTNLDILDI